MRVASVAVCQQYSFVAAGVIPRLREQQRWLVLRMRPATRPFDFLAAELTRGGELGAAEASSGGGRLGEGLDMAPPSADVRRLARALRENDGELALALRDLAERSGAKVLLFVDQLEELFALGVAEDDARRFVHALWGAADDASDPVRVLLTLRDDFLGRLAEAAATSLGMRHIMMLRAPARPALAALGAAHRPAPAGLPRPYRGRVRARFRRPGRVPRERQRRSEREVVAPRRRR
jgi:hypothetical protein